MDFIPTIPIAVTFDPNAPIGQQIITIAQSPVPMGRSLLEWTLSTTSGPDAEFRPPSGGDGVVFQHHEFLEVRSTQPGQTTWAIEVENENTTSSDQSVPYVIWAGVSPNFQSDDPTLVVVPDPTGSL